MTKNFFNILKTESDKNNGGYFALITASNSPDLFGQKSFFSGIHPVLQKDSLSSYWNDFWNKLDFQQVLPKLIQNSDGSLIFVEKLCKKPKLVILGGGHVGYYVYKLGIMLGFEATIVDDRNEFCSTERFPQAVQTLCLPFDEALKLVPSGDGVYYVIVTRGHKYDNFCVESLLKKSYSYIGMIGSKRKVGLIHENLSAHGFTSSQINSIFTPIGLSIGAQTPEEIAVSILAQIIEQKNSKGANSYSDDEALDFLSNTKSDCVLCMIIRKSGSIPRGAGSKMVVAENGLSIGSIGGGKIEFDAINEAISLCQAKNTKPIIRTFNMDGASAESDGMVCGGTADVYIEHICAEPTPPFSPRVL